MQGAASASGGTSSAADTSVRARPGLEHDQQVDDPPDSSAEPVLKLRDANASLNEPLEVGNTVLALVVHPGGPHGHGALSLRRA
jgi:hypothetical protein